MLRSGTRLRHTDDQATVLRHTDDQTTVLRHADDQPSLPRVCLLFETPTPVQVFAIHPLTSEDVLTDYTREKVEVYDNYLFVIIQVCAS